MTEAAVAALLLLLAGCGGGGGSGATTTTTKGATSPTIASGPTTTLNAAATFTAPDGSFAAAFPSTPERSEQQTEAKGAQLNVVFYTARVGEDAVYQVGYVDYPESLGPLDPEATLQGSVAGAAERVHGTIERRSRLTFRDRPAIDSVIRVTQGVVTARTLLDGRRLWFVQAVSRADVAAEYEAFLSSFRLHPGG